MKRHGTELIAWSIVSARQSRRNACTCGAAEEGSQAFDLLFLPKFDEVFGHSPFSTAEQHPEIANQNENSPNYVRPASHLIEASKDLPDGMVTKSIILIPGVQSFANAFHLGAIHGTVVIV